MKVVLDTNIIISALFWEGNEKKVLDKCRAKELEMITSPEILDEVDGVLEMKFEYPDDKRVEFLRNLLRISKLVFPDVEIDAVSDDTMDNRILECAVSGCADYIISGDHHLTDLGEYESIKILKASEFLKIL
jgi:putative PIN family toxin of toxin-antitoxin system